MGEIFSKIIFFIFVLPFLMLSKGYEMLKKFMSKHGYTFDRLYVLLAALILLLILVLLLQYGYH